jgi:hypothetical protein
MQHIGEYNGIYFLEGAGGIVGICDRANRKDVVRFAEDGLIDLANPPRPISELIVGGAVTVRDGVPLHLYVPNGFGRTVSYEPLESGKPGVLAVGLTIGLPDRALYRVRWETLSRDDDTFTLDDGISVTVSTFLPWAYQDSVLQVQTGDQPGEIIFVVESQTPTSRVRDIVIIACEGHEREAIMVRSRCGPGFVPCFVVSEQQWSDHVKKPGEVLVGPDAPDFDLLPADAPTLTAPDTEAAYGPALALAVANGARLVLTGQGSTIRLTGDASREWELSEVLNSPLSLFGTGREMVVGESTSADLVVCQAVGYASMRRCQIAFIPPVPGVSGTDMAALSRECAAAVPPELRELDADVLAIFTRTQPLHLTPMPDGRRWTDRHLVAHLPGQVTSMLLSRPVEPAPRLQFGVVFDALRAFTTTEGEVYRDKLAEGISYPILLSRKDARREVLQEVLHRVDVDLLMIIAHGEEDHFEDADNDGIPGNLIRTWQLRGQPVVFNNSCSSWSSTGEAFLAAGARAYIGTLWPVANDVAAGIGSYVGGRVHDEGILPLLNQAVRGIDDPETAAYVYIGLPDARFMAREAIDEEEALAVLTEAMNQLYRCMTELAAEGELDVAVSLHNAAVPALRARFAAMVTPGKVPLHLPSPLAQASVLDIDYVLANASLNFLRNTLPGVAPERTSAVLDQIRHLMQTAYRELTTRSERHRAHLGSEDANTSIASQLMLTAMFVTERALPFASLFADLGCPDEARYWMDAAVQLIGPPDDESVIQRIREGATEKCATAWSPDGKIARSVTIDWLAEAVDKSMLAYRFGEVREGLGDKRQAIAFYEAAIELTETGSAIEAESRRRLRTLLAAGDDILGEHVAAFETARRGGNAHTSSTAAADLLRYAAANRRPLPNTVVQQALELDSHHGASHHAVSHRLNILGAAMTYYASQNEQAGIEAMLDEVFGYLREYESTAVVPLNELAAWYYQTGDLPTAIDAGLGLGTRLRDLHCFGSAARILCFTGRVILRAYKTQPDRELLERFLDVSEMIGRILTEHVDVHIAIGDQMTDIRTETESIWRQIADHEDWRLASRGYGAYTRWPTAPRIPEWELLSAALHPRNVQAVRNVAAMDGLRREAHVSINADFTVDMKTTTHRRGGTGPDIVYGLCPLYRGAAERHSPSANFVAGTAVFPLRHRDSVTIKESNVPALQIDNSWATYHERWGSRTVPHELRIDLAPGLIPAAIRSRRRGGVSARATIRFDKAGCHIVVCGEFPNEPWLADLTISFGHSPELGDAMTAPTMPFNQEMPIELYSLLIPQLPSSGCE